MMKFSILKGKIVEERRAQRIWQYMGPVKKERKKKKTQEHCPKPNNRDV